jgi:hypothetical protein
MSDFLIYAARLQDAGVCSLWVSLGSDKTRTRLMHVSPAAATTPHELIARYPTRTFELCGTDRVLERVKDDMLYSEGGVTPEKVHAAIAAYPLLRDDLCVFLADWTLVQMPTDEEVAAYELTPEEVAGGERTADKVKAWLQGMDIERRRNAARAA